MSNTNHNMRKIICCIFSVIFLCAAGAQAAALPPDPDNAALLYYQAFLLLPDPNSMIAPVLWGAEPNEEVRKYLDDAREAIDLAEVATKIPGCSWGIMRSEGGSSLITIIGKLRQLLFLFEVDTMAHAVDGEHRTALEKCLCLRQLARHIANEGMLGYLTSLAVHGESFEFIQHVLGYMPSETDTLEWLQVQLSIVQGSPPLPGRAMEIDLEDTLKLLSTHPNDLEWWRNNILEHIEDENTKQEFMNLTDEELLEQAETSCNRFLTSVNRVIGSDMPYQQKCSELQNLMGELTDQILSGNPVGILWTLLTNNVVRIYDIYVRCTAYFNAIRAAIEIYLEAAQTGQLPETLPANLPKDPFSGQDFEYEITEEGFTLRCREKAINEDDVWEYEFVIAQKE